MVLLLCINSLPLPPAVVYLRINLTRDAIIIFIKVVFEAFHYLSVAIEVSLLGDG